MIGGRRKSGLLLRILMNLAEDVRDRRGVSIHTRIFAGRRIAHKELTCHKHDIMIPHEAPLMRPDTMSRG